MTKNLTVAALAAAFALGGGWMLTRPDTSGAALGTGQDLLPGAAMAQEATATEEPVAEDTAASEEPATEPLTIPEMAQGAEDAPVTIIEYASYTCPHCANFHANQYQNLKEYIADGRVRFVFREVYFDRFGLWASMITRCSGDPMRFFGMTDVLYDTQREWIGEGEPDQIADNLRTIALTAGLEPAQVDACMQDQPKAEALIAWFEENATRDGIQATPTLFINGEQYANMAWEDMAAIIDPIVEESGWTASQ